jgi:hypothetical protein
MMTILNKILRREETKTCSACGRTLPVSEFYNRTRSKDGKRTRCKQCDNLAHKDWISRHAYSERRKRSIELSDAREDGQFETLFGGCTIYILNKPLVGEHKYNVVFTSGKLFKTSDRDEFLQYINETF